MDKSVRLEIENEYKTQISELEENLEQIGEFEASVKPAIGLKMLYSVVNYIFSIGFGLIGTLGLITSAFFFQEFVVFVEKTLDLGIDLPYASQNLIMNPTMMLVKYSILFFTVLFLFLSFLLGLVRRKNSVIIASGIVVSDFKIRVLKMLEVSKDRLKNFNKLVADEQMKNTK